MRYPIPNVAAAYANFLRFARGQQRPRPVPGPQPERLGGTQIFVIPNPSGANAHVTAADLARWYDRLADFVAAAREEGPSWAGPGISGPRTPGATMSPLDRKESPWNL